MRPRFFLVLCSLWGLLGTSGLALAHENTTEPLAGPVMIGGKMGGDFTLTDFSGKKVSLSQYAGKVVILNFGYTSCPDICPITLANLKQTMEKLEAQASQVQVLWVTVDPERDTPSRLKSYLGGFHASFLGLTGTHAEISKVAHQYHTLYQKDPVAEKPAAKEGHAHHAAPQKNQKADHAHHEAYLVSHTDFVYLLDKTGKVQMLYPSDVPAEALAQDIRQQLNL